MKPDAKKNYSPLRSTGVDSGVYPRDFQLPLLPAMALQGAAGDIVNSISPYTEVQAGRVTHFKLGQRLVFDRADLEEFLGTNRVDSMKKAPQVAPAGPSDMALAVGAKPRGPSDQRHRL